jgi:capsular exopolysaccharide synthesis family protein
MESRDSIDLDIGQYLLALKRRWLPATSIFLTTVGLSIIAATLLKPSYEAEGKLLFKLPTFSAIGNNVVPSNSEAGAGGDLKTLVSTQNPITTQIEVMTSRPLLQKLIAQLPAKSNPGKLLTVNDLQAGLSAKIIGGSDVLQIAYKSRNPEQAAEVVNTLMNVYLENDILTSQSEAEAARQFMDKQLPKTQAAMNDAELAVRKFKQQNSIVDLTEESRSAVGIIGNLENSINSVQSELEQATAQSQELRKKINLNSEEAIAVSAISQSPAIQSILTQLQEVERQLATESSRFSDNNPIIISLKEKQTKLTTLLSQQVRTTIGSQAQIPQGLLKIGELKQGLITELIRSEVQQTGLVKKLTSLQNSRASHERRANVIPQLAQTQRQLERQLEVSQSTHQSLLKKVQELQLAKTRNTSSARIIGSAIVPKQPSKSMKPLVVGLGMLLGAFLGTGAVAVLELRDKSLKTVKEIEKMFGYTLLGVIPANQQQKKRARDRQPALTSLEVAVRDTPQSVTSEMSRSIQANLRFLGADRPLKTITITSAVANEGKSKVAANLAAAIAGLGQKVLLIDADLRIPYQHQFWKVPLKKGLSELLVKRSKLQQISWTVMENLDLLTAGARPPNPLSSLESNQMRSLIQSVSELYDFVIIDTPPLLVASDALTVGQLTDGILLVARPGVIEPNQARTAQEKLKMSQSNVLGVIVNGVIAQNETEDYFSASQEYFSDEQDVAAPWTDYMTQLGETIADRSSQGTRFTDEKTPTTMLGQSNRFQP